MSAPRAPRAAAETVVDLKGWLDGTTPEARPLTESFPVTASCAPSSAMYFTFGAGDPIHPCHDRHARVMIVTLECRGGDPILCASQGQPPVINLRSRTRPVRADAWDAEAFETQQPRHELRVAAPAARRPGRTTAEWAGGHQIGHGRSAISTEEGGHPFRWTICVFNFEGVCAEQCHFVLNVRVAAAAAAAFPAAAAAAFPAAAAAAAGSAVGRRHARDGGGRGSNEEVTRRRRPGGKATLLLQRHSLDALGEVGEVGEVGSSYGSLALRSPLRSEIHSEIDPQMGSPTVGSPWPTAAVAKLAAARRAPIAAVGGGGEGGEAGASPTSPTSPTRSPHGVHQRLAANAALATELGVWPRPCRATRLPPSPSPPRAVWALTGDTFRDASAGAGEPACRGSADCGDGWGLRAGCASPLRSASSVRSVRSDCVYADELDAAMRADSLADSATNVTNTIRASVRHEEPVDEAEGGEGGGGGAGGGAGGVVRLGDDGDGRERVLWAVESDPVGLAPGSPPPGLAVSRSSCVASIG